MALANKTGGIDSLPFIDRARSVCATAVERCGVSPDPGQLDDLARLIASTQRLLPTDFRTISVPRPLNIDTARAVAERIRSMLEVGFTQPLVQLPNLLLDRFNIPLFRCLRPPLAHGCAIIDRCAVVFLPTTPEPAEDLVTCAHNLAHLLLFMSQRPELPRCTFHRSPSNSAKAPLEHFADAFAGHLLVPQQALKHAAAIVRRRLGAVSPSIGDVELLYIARIFAVSFLTIARSCERVGMLPPGSAIALDRFLTVRFGGAERRAQVLHLPPQPALQIPSFPVPLTSTPQSLPENCDKSNQHLRSPPSRPQLLAERQDQSRIRPAKPHIEPNPIPKQPHE